MTIRSIPSQHNSWGIRNTENIHQLHTSTSQGSDWCESNFMLHAIKQILFNIVGIYLFFPWLSPFVQNMLSIQQENHFRATENDSFHYSLFSLVNENLCETCVFNYVHIS